MPVLAVPGPERDTILGSLQLPLQPSSPQHYLFLAPQPHLILPGPLQFPRSRSFSLVGSYPTSPLGWSATTYGHYL